LFTSSFRVSFSIVFFFENLISTFFRIPKLTQEKIECYAEENSLNKPFELMALENEKEESKEDLNKITVKLLISF
jgi:hypothetical protein